MKDHDRIDHINHLREHMAREMGTSLSTNPTEPSDEGPISSTGEGTLLPEAGRPADPRVSNRQVRVLATTVDALARNVASLMAIRVNDAVGERWERAAWLVASMVVSLSAGFFGVGVGAVLLAWLQ